MTYPLDSRFLPFLEQVLTPNRLRHSIGVMQVMEELAPVYQLDPQQAITAGLLHDAAKDLPEAQWQQIVARAGIKIDEAADENYLLYLHGPVGAQFVRDSLGVDDPLILDAIRMHTFNGSGVNFDHPLVWCLRFSDILEPNRDWSRVPQFVRNAHRLKELAYAGRMDEATLLQTGSIIQMFEQQSFPVHSNLRRIVQILMNRLQVDETFFAPDNSQSGG